MMIRKKNKKYKMDFLIFEFGCFFEEFWKTGIEIFRIKMVKFQFFTIPIFHNSNSN